MGDLQGINKMTLQIDNGYWPFTLQKCILGIWWFLVDLPSWPFTLRPFHKILSSWNSFGISQMGHRWSSINWRCIRMDAYFVGRMYVYFMCMNMFQYAWTFGCMHHIYVYTCFVSGVTWFFFFSLIFCRSHHEEIRILGQVSSERRSTQTQILHLESHQHIAEWQLSLTVMRNNASLNSRLVSTLLVFLTWVCTWAFVSCIQGGFFFFNNLRSRNLTVQERWPLRLLSLVGLDGPLGWTSWWPH